MFRGNSLVATMLKKHWRSAVFAAAAAPLLLVGSGARAASTTDGPVKLLFTVPVPVIKANNPAGGLFSFDISYVDKTTQTYYLADRSNKAVDVVDANTGTFLKQIQGKPAFAGVGPLSDTSGPNGVVASYPWLFVTDASSRVRSFNLVTGKQVDLVNTGGAGANRADELAYDAADGLLLVINDADKPPFGTFISVNKSTGKLTIGKKVVFHHATGAEQPVWDPASGRFFQALPQLGPNVAQGAVLRINPSTAKIEAEFGINLCGPAGLTLGPNQTLLTNCNTTFDTAGNIWDPTKNVTATPYNVILSAKTGFILAYVPGAGAGDEAWYNAGDNHFYSTAQSSPLAPHDVTGATLTAQGAAALAVIDGTSMTLDQLVPTFNVPAKTTAPAHGAGTAHSVAANPLNNLVFVPLAANNAIQGCLKGCIGVYGRQNNDTD
ncbi:MAG: YncE family protein [Stellaceae bacterium]